MTTWIQNDYRNTKWLTEYKMTTWIQNNYLNTKWLPEYKMTTWIHNDYLTTAVSESVSWFWRPWHIDHGSDYSDYTPFWRVSIKFRPPAKPWLRDYRLFWTVSQDFEGIGILTMGSDYGDYSSFWRVSIKIPQPAESWLRDYRLFWRVYQDFEGLGILIVVLTTVTTPHFGECL